jgi:RNA polymerase sigma factor (sigma-70 family)
MAVLTRPSPFDSARRGSTGVASDDALRERVAAGDDDAFRELYTRHHSALSRFSRSLLHDDEDAQEALQATWTKAWTGLGSSDRKAPVRAWLFRVARNEAVNVIRARRGTEDLAAQDVAAPAFVEETVETNERLAQLWRDLGTLSERQRTALVLRELSGLDHNEIGLVLGGTAATAKQAIHDARAALHDARDGRDTACAKVRDALADGGRHAARGRRVRAHLRACPGCSAYAQGVLTRPGDLGALLPPLPLVLGAGLLDEVLGGATASAAGVGAGAGAAASAPTMAAAGGVVGGTHLTSVIAVKAFLALIAVGAPVTAVAVTGSGGNDEQPRIISRIEEPIARTLLLRKAVPTRSDGKGTAERRASAGGAVPGGGEAGRSAPARGAAGTTAPPPDRPAAAGDRDDDAHALPGRPHPAPAVAPQAGSATPARPPTPAAQDAPIPAPSTPAAGPPASPKPKKGATPAQPATPSEGKAPAAPAEPAAPPEHARGREKHEG